MSLSRVLFGVLLVVNLAAFGFTLGAMLAAEFFVPKEEGMAGSAMVVICGASGALIGIVSGLVLANKLAANTLLRVTVGAIVLAGTAIGLIFLRVAK